MAHPPISVLHFSNSTALGGVEDHILTLLAGLDGSRFRQHFVCTPAVAVKLRSYVPEQVELIPLDFRKFSQPLAGIRLWDILRNRRIHILHSHMFWSSLFASPVGCAAGVPVIVETTHVREQWRKGWFKSRFIVDRMIGRCVTYYIANSDANRRYLIEQKGLPATKMTVIRSGSDVRRFDPNRVAPISLKRDLGFNDSDPVIVMIGRLEAQKGHTVLLKAMSTVKRAYPGVRLLIIGEGGLKDELEIEIHELGLNNNVRILGYQLDLLDWIALADFTVLPSLWEGLPLTPIESLAAGRTVVATAVDGTPEVVVDGVTGITVPPGDSGRLAEAIIRLLKDPEERCRLARAGRELVMAKFTHERLIQETEEFYLSAWERSLRSHRIENRRVAESSTT